MSFSEVKQSQVISRPCLIHFDSIFFFGVKLWNSKPLCVNLASLNRGWPLLLLGLLLSVCISLIPASAGLGLFGALSVLGGLLLATYGCGELSYLVMNGEWQWAGAWWSNGVFLNAEIKKKHIIVCNKACTDTCVHGCLYVFVYVGTARVCHIVNQLKEFNRQSSVLLAPAACKQVVLDTWRILRNMWNQLEYLRLSNQFIQCPKTRQVAQVGSVRCAAKFPRHTTADSRFPTDHAHLGGGELGI